MAGDEKMVRISITIPESVANALREYCEKERRSVSAQLTLLAEKLLADQNEAK